MSKEMKLIPNLRFPEFEKDGKWVEKELGNEEVSDFVNDKVNSEKLTLNNYISTDNMLPDYFGITKASKLPTTNRVTEFDEGDILISNIRPYLKKVWKSDRKGGASNDVLVFRSGSGVKSTFLEFILKNDAFINYVMKSAKGVKMPRGDKDSILEYPIRIPSPEEQQKIASCLSSLDELIAAHSEKLETLKDHKKGLMQNLFPQKGQKVPNYRFPEFEKDGEWVEKKLGEIGNPLMCKRIFKKQTTPNPENGIPFYKIGTFGKETDSYISVELYNEFKSKYNFPNKGDILISASGTVGRLVIYDGSPAYFQDSNIVWLGHDEKQVINGFLFYCYSKVNWQTSDGGVIKRLYNSDLKNITIIFPENEKEQQKISSCLSALDEIITAQSEKIEQLQQHKKGLMQGLFPNSNK